jgi:peptide/nickel transport system permease protein/oligopeptide transport system permease protein
MPFISEVWRHYKKNYLSLIGLGIILTLIICAIIAPLITVAGFDEQLYYDEINNFPSRAHFFGVDSVGRDYFSRVIYGIRVSLSIGFSVSFFALFIGVPIGALAGYYGGWVDWITMRIIEIFSSVPRLLIAILVVTLVGSGLKNIIFILAAVGWIDVCRLLRGQIIALKEREYTLAAKALGAKPITILFKHLLPNAISPVIIGMVLTVPRSIMLESMLSFIGVGVNAPTPSWGVLISQGLNYIQFYWHLALFPSLFLAGTILSLSFVGDGLRDALDPKLRGRR